MFLSAHVRNDSRLAGCGIAVPAAVPRFYYLIFRPLVRNIAERKQVEAELRVAAVAFEIKDPALITDAKANIIRANQKLLDKLALAWKKSWGRTPVSSNQDCMIRNIMNNYGNSYCRTGAWSGEIRIKTKEGRILHPFWLTITAVKNEQQETTHYIGIYNF